MHCRFDELARMTQLESATTPSNTSPRRALQNVASYGHCKRECCRSTQGPSSFRLIFQSFVQFYLRPCFQPLPSHFSHTSSYCWLLSPSWEASSCSATQEIPISQWDPKSSLPCWHDPDTGPYPEPDESSTHVYHVCHTHFRIIFPSMSRLYLVISAFKAFMLISPSCSHETPALLSNRRLITMLTSTDHWSLSGSTWN
jgi:hypothetical protein